MKNFVTSTTTGSRFEINVNLPHGWKGGANWSTVTAAGAKRHCDWFVSNNGELTCLCTFELNGQNIELKGIATFEDGDLTKWVENKVAARKAQEERTANYKAGQEWGY